MILTSQTEIELCDFQPEQTLMVHYQTVTASMSQSGPCLLGCVPHVNNALGNSRDKI